MKNKKILMILVLFVVISTFIGGTLAFWAWETSESQRTNVVLTSGPGFVCSADGGGAIDSASINMMPATCMNANNAIIREIDVQVAITNNDSNIYLDLWLDIDSLAQELSNSQNLRYALTDSPASCTDVIFGAGNFNGMVAGNKVNILSKVYTNTEPIVYNETFYLYVWLDAAETNVETAGKSFQLSLNGECGDYQGDSSPVLAITSTNEVASSQTATLSMNDDNGIVSYYFGKTNPNTTEVTWNDITSNTNFEVNSTVDSSGTWYLGARDTEGNMTVINKIFYQTTLSVSNATVSPDTIITMRGNTLILPTPVVNNNYQFVGWYDTVNFMGDVITTHTPTSNATLYGNVVEIVDSTTYTISYNANGGSGAPASQIKAKDVNLSLSSVKPTKTGYTCIGWSTDSEATSVEYQLGGTYTANADITLYAVWRLNKVYINYNVNGGIVTSETSYGGTHTTDASGLVYREGNLLYDSIDYGGSTTENGVANYDNIYWMNITKTGYTALVGAEWLCMSGCTVADSVYDHSAVYDHDDFCDASNGDCTVVLGVNWQSTEAYIPGESGTFEIYGVDTDVIANNGAAMKIEVSWSETYNPYTNTSIVSITNMRAYCTDTNYCYGNFWVGGPELVAQTSDGVYINNEFVLPMSFSTGGYRFYITPNTYATLYTNTAFPWSSSPITHNDDGTLSVPIRLYFSATTSGENNVWVDFDTTQTITLTTIT